MVKSDYSELLAQLAEVKEAREPDGAPRQRPTLALQGSSSGARTCRLRRRPGRFDEYGVLASETISVPGLPTRGILVVADDGMIAGGARGGAGRGKVQQFRLLGDAAFTAALADFTAMAAGTSHIAVARPPVVASATGRLSNFDELGGAEVHASENRDGRPSGRS